jgi:hypothetical protein
MTIFMKLVDMKAFGCSEVVLCVYRFKIKLEPCCQRLHNGASQQLADKSTV